MDDYDPPPLSEEEVLYIIRDWRTSLDTCTDDPALFAYDLLDHTCTRAECEERMVEPGRKDMNPFQKQQLDAYIRHLAAEYPFQLQKAFAMGRYHKALDMWVSTYNFTKVMRVI